MIKDCIKNIKILACTVVFIFFASSTLTSADESEVGVGLELGWGGFDIGAKQTAQTIANLSGSTVTYNFDQGAFVGRIFLDYRLSSVFLIEGGYFISNTMGATYTLAGASATENYSVRGFDLSMVNKQKDSPFFFKAGFHSSEIDGSANVTIGGTLYAANATASGSGALIGAGLQYESSRVGLTYYGDIGGDSNANTTMLYYGFRF